jgi:hypothetical protein
LIEQLAERVGFYCRRHTLVTLKLTDSDNSLCLCGFQAPCFSGYRFRPG